MNISMDETSEKLEDIQRKELRKAPLKYCEFVTQNPKTAFGR